MKEMLVLFAVWAALVLFLILIVGCTFSCYPPQPPPPTKPTDPPVNEAVSFTQVSSTILVPICGGCHGNAGGYNFQSYQGVMQAVVAKDPDNSKLCYVVRSALMPKAPSPPLNADQVNLICNWIAQGAKP